MELLLHVCVALLKHLLYLGTDVINFPKLFESTLSQMIKDLMGGTGAGIILADNNFIILFHNYNQLNLVEMPQFLFR